MSDLTLGQIGGFEDVNIGYTLLSGYLVFFMQAGFAMLSAGSVRAKNAKNIILLNLLDACFGCVAWYITGFAFAFGDPSIDEVQGGEFPYYTPFIGHRYFFQIDLPKSSYAQWFFQFTFAATSATIVSGAVAERCKFETYLCYNLMLVSFVYPVVAHWVWSPFGWMSASRNQLTAGSSSYVRLFGSGVYDFAGDGPVHMLGGFASLAGAWVLGPRLGRYDAGGVPVDMPGHSASLTLLGVFLLWFGWYGFNPGSTNAIIGPKPGFSSISALVAVNTTISAAGATISTLFVVMLHNYITSGVVVWDLIIAGNGALAGLVSITGGCAFVETWAAFVIGLIGGVVYYGLSRFILLKLKVDDPLDAIAVHAGGGMWGMLGCAAFATQNLVDEWYPPIVDVGASTNATEIVTVSRPYGFVMGGDGTVLAAHLVYILVIAGWTLGIMTPFFYLLKRIGIMRVPPEVEVQGLDISYHGGHSYPHGEVNVQVPGASNYVSKFTMEEMIEEALRLVESRGWTPPENGSVHNDVSGRGNNTANGVDTIAEQTEPLDTTGNNTANKVSSLEKARKAMQKVYSTSQISVGGGDSATMSTTTSSPTPIVDGAIKE